MLGLVTLLVAVNKGHNIMMFVWVGPDRLNIVLVDIIDDSVLSLVEEWATFDDREDYPKVQIRGLALISASWLDPVR